jgi:hypothetical protein
VIGTDIQEEDGFAEAVVTIWKGRTRHWWQRLARPWISTLCLCKSFILFGCWVLKSIDLEV